MGFYTAVTSAFNFFFTCWLHWNKKLFKERIKSEGYFQKFIRDFIHIGFQEDICSLVPGLFYRILRRRGAWSKSLVVFASVLENYSET